MKNHDAQNSSASAKSSSLSFAHHQKLNSAVEKTRSNHPKQSAAFHPPQNGHHKFLAPKLPPKPQNFTSNQNPSRNPSQINSTLSTVKSVNAASINSNQNHSHHNQLSKLSSLSVKVSNDFERALKAIRDGHIFEIRGWANSAVRPYFLRRGWLEKSSKGSTSKIPASSISTTSQILNANANANQSLLLDSAAQKMLDDRPSNFIWACYTHQVDWPNKLDYQHVNRHPQGGFASKRFLVSTFQNLQWVGNEGARISQETACGFGCGFPRSYRLYLDEEKQTFEQDFKFTSCLALLKFFVSAFPSLITNSKSHSNSNSNSNSGKSKTIDTLSSESDLDLDVNLETNLDRILPLVNFALLQVKVYISRRKHEDIDDKNEIHSMTQTPISMSTGLDWNSFLQQSFHFTHNPANFKTDETEIKTAHQNFDTDFDSKAFDDAFANVEEILEQVEQFWPQFHIDGHRNVWIFKPANGTRGHGIILMDNYTEISQKFLTSDTKIPPWWIVQKYIERPLTIFDTKFDLRQWFLVTSWNPLIAWIYKKSYLRFSGKPYNLDDLGEKIHLTNHSVQQKYHVDDSRNSNLPPNNMWSSDQFQDYLQRIGKPNVWKEIIYEGMKQILLKVLLSFRDSIVHCPRTFQMQGADFMIADDFRPYLIEINGTPVLSNSTQVTAKLCPQACIDSIRVALDWNPESSKNTSVGDFELFYREPSKLKYPSKATQEIVVQGKSI